MSLQNGTGPSVGALEPAREHAPGDGATTILAHAASSSNSAPAALGWALAYAERGWFVFPCGRNKRPRIAKEHGGRGYLDATTDAQQIRAWWAKYPDAVPGIACEASELVVADVDTKRDGLGLETWARVCGLNPHGAALVASTPSGGRHYVYAADGARIKTAAPCRTDWPGVDTRACGGYFCPPCGEPGREWLEGDGLEDEPGPLPAWLLAELPKVGEASEGETTKTPLGADLLEGVAEGSRNAAAATLAGKLLAHGLRDEMPALLVGWNKLNRPPLAEQELRAVVESVVRTDRRNHPERWAPPVEIVPGGNLSPKAQSETRQQRRSRARLRTLDELKGMPAPRWLVRGLVQAASKGFVIALPNVGKTFAVLGMLLSIYHGRPCFGLDVLPGSVLLIVGEGIAGIGRRVEAWELEHVPPGAMPEGRYFEVGTGLPPLSSADGRAELAALIAELEAKHGHAPSVVAIDTLSSLWGGESEDRAEYAAPFMAELERLQDAHGCAFVVLHHVVKTQNGQPAGLSMSSLRGSGAFAGAADFVLGLEPTDEGARLVTLKQKDAEKTAPMRLRLHRVPMGQDEDGTPLSGAFFVRGAESDAAPVDVEAERTARRVAKFEQNVAAVVEAMRALGTATKVDAVARAAGVRTVDGRAAFDAAMARGLIVATGSQRRPVYLPASGTGGCVQHPIPLGTSGTPSVLTSGNVRDDADDADDVKEGAA